MEPTLRHVKWPVGPGGFTPPIGPHSHGSELFGKMLVRAIRLKRRTISAKRTHCVPGRIPWERAVLDRRGQGYRIKTLEKDAQEIDSQKY